MMDLNQALEQYARPVPDKSGWFMLPLDVIDARTVAARAYRNLLANGQRVEPDYEAAVQMWWGMLGREGQSPEPNTVLAKLIVDAAIGDKLLIDPPTEEEKATGHEVCITKDGRNLHDEGYCDVTGQDYNEWRG